MQQQRKGVQRMQPVQPVPVQPKKVSGSVGLRAPGVSDHLHCIL